MHGNGLELETATGLHRVLDRHAAWQWIQRRLATAPAPAPAVDGDTAPDELTATVDQYFEEYFFE
ncbi:hypothetical protein [Cognatilysobacter lacus]|uniref:Uncharacterized protein n=1 Tax=Cognatilysobacter lacus TaxID=1643323 RepID=A0A5D8Z9A9_9GAMM|nr:hypothetical protein [Lysobacter lacus]TZF89254.1 hypothetical protein FW784_08925 [Lysobacter lacus]